MISQYMEDYLRELTSSTVTDVFIGLTLVVFFVSLGMAWFRKHPQFLEYAPTLMTSLGILGTFTGVVIGLLGFNTNDIAGSIPTLLEGLKTAFITSIVGMVAAMLFNGADAWLFAPRRARGELKKEDVTPGDIHAALVQQSQLLEKIAQGMSSQEEGSTVGQLKLLRSDFGDFTKDTRDYNTQFSRKLWQEMERFAEMMSKSATSQLIEALRQVIQDFNKNLMEQFGENFKALDASVKKLVDWQAEYKVQVEKMGEQYQQSVDSLVSTRQAVAGIWDECKSIPLAMAELREVLTTNQHQIQELQRHLEAFVKMRDAAVEAVPIIREKVEEIGEQLAGGAAVMRGAIEQGAAELSTAVAGASSQLASSTQTVQASLEEVGSRLLTGSNEMKVALHEGAEHFRNSVTTTQGAFAELSHTVKNSSEQLSETLRETSTEVSNTSRDMLARMQASVTEMQKDITATAKVMEEHSQQVHEQFRRTASEFKESNAAIMQVVAQAASRIQDEIKRSAEQTLMASREHMDKSTAGMDAHMRDALAKVGNTINKEMEVFEKSIFREIEKSMNVMGDSLVQITSRFVKDYEQMVKRMDQVIRRHERLEG